MARSVEIPGGAIETALFFNQVVDPLIKNGLQAALFSRLSEITRSVPQEQMQYLLLAVPALIVVGSAWEWWLLHYRQFSDIALTLGIHRILHNSFVSVTGAATLNYAYDNAAANPWTYLTLYHGGIGNEFMTNLILRAGIGFALSGTKRLLYHLGVMDPINDEVYKLFSPTYQRIGQALQALGQFPPPNYPDRPAHEMTRPLLPSQTVTFARDPIAALRF